MDSKLTCPICGAEPYMMVSWNEDLDNEYRCVPVEPALAVIRCHRCGLSVESRRFGEDGQRDMAARDDARRDAARRWRGLSYRGLEAGGAE